MIKSDFDHIAPGDLTDLPLIEPNALQAIDVASLCASDAPLHPPRILILYGSLRDGSYSRYAAEEGARVLRVLGCDVPLFDPTGLGAPDDPTGNPDKIQDLRDLVMWSEGMVWSSPERHGAMTGLMKTQIDHIPLAPIGGIRPTQGKTLAVMQVCGGSQSFNTVNQLRILGRWMRLVTIPNQSSVPAAYNKFEKGRMIAGSHYNRIVDVMEELARFTIMTRGRPQLTDRYSERVETLEQTHARVTKL